MRRDIAHPTSVETHYTEAGADYAAWSPSFNMHFGYYRWGLNPFDREAMLEEMNRLVHQRLDVAVDRKSHIADLGAGVGAPARALAKSLPKAHVTGVTIVPWQVAKANALTRCDDHDSGVRFVLADYTRTGFADASFDAAYAIESACHDHGAAKEGFIREAARILKPGAKLVVADGFLERSSLPPVLRGVFSRVQHNWAVEQFANRAAFLRALETHGFRVLECRGLFWRVAPSAAHIPWVTTRFMIRELFFDNKPFTAARRGHVLASALAPLVGLARPYFGYYLIVAERTDSRS